MKPYRSHTRRIEIAHQGRRVGRPECCGVLSPVSGYLPAGGAVRRPLGCRSATPSVFVVEPRSVGLSSSLGLTKRGPGRRRGEHRPCGLAGWAVSTGTPCKDQAGASRSEHPKSWLPEAGTTGPGGRLEGRLGVGSRRRTFFGGSTVRRSVGVGRLPQSAGRVSPHSVPQPSGQDRVPPPFFPTRSG